MPLNREQIKHAPVSSEVWRNNQTQYGGLWFNPRKIRPHANHILIELDADPPVSSTIIAPQTAAKDIGTRIGTVLAIGPGKWHEKPGLSWEITKRIFKPTTLKPGDRVVIGHYSDWESWHCDPESRDNNIVLCQEADVRVVIENDVA